VDEKFTPHKRVPSKRWKRGRRKWAYKIAALDSKGDVCPAPERNTEAIRKALRRAKEEAGFSPDIIPRDGLPPTTGGSRCSAGGRGKGRLKRIPSQLGLRPNWEGPTRSFYTSGDF